MEAELLDFNVDNHLVWL